MDRQGRREGEGAEDDEGRWAIMQPFDNSDGEDPLNLSSVLDEDLTRVHLKKLNNLGWLIDFPLYKKEISYGFDNI